MLGAAAALSAVGVLGVPRLALADGGRRVRSAARLDGVHRVNGLFGTPDALYAAAVREGDEPALLARHGSASTWSAVPLPDDAAELADGVVLPDGDVLLVGAVTATRTVDLSETASPLPGQPGEEGEPADGADEESYVFTVSTLRPAAWRGDPARGDWERLTLGTDEPGRLTGVGTADGTTVVVGHSFAPDSETPKNSYSLVTTTDGRRWRSATLPTGPLVEGAVVDVEHVEGRWLAVGFDLDGSVALMSRDGLDWAPVGVPRSGRETQVQEVSVSADGGAAVVLTASAEDTGDGVSRVLDPQNGSEAAMSSSDPVFSVQVLGPGTAAVASSSDGTVVIEEVRLVGD